MCLITSFFQKDSEIAHPEIEVTDINMTPEELNKLRKDLDFMMTRYEGELKRPIRNVVTGKLPRTLLIQVATKYSTSPSSLNIAKPRRTRKLNSFTYLTCYRH